MYSGIFIQHVIFLNAWFVFLDLSTCIKPYSILKLPSLAQELTPSLLLLRICSFKKGLLNCVLRFTKALVY